MNRAYWDAVADDYDRQVLSVFDHDASGRVCEGIVAAGRKTGRAADLGCGVGKFVPLLAEAFGSVEACDHSERGLRRARRRCGHRPNVRFHHVDLTCDVMPFAPVDFVLCVNVLLMPSLDERLRAWRTVTNQVARGGTLLLVVPSLESIHLEGLRAVDTGLDCGESCAEALARRLPSGNAALDLHMGVHALEGVPTKHYLRVELEQMLAAHHFEVGDVRELTYAAPASGIPSSWDWLARAKRL